MLGVPHGQNEPVSPSLQKRSHVFGVILLVICVWWGFNKLYAHSFGPSNTVVEEYDDFLLALPLRHTVGVMLLDEMYLDSSTVVVVSHDTMFAGAISALAEMQKDIFVHVKGSEVTYGENLLGSIIGLLGYTPSREHLVIRKERLIIELNGRDFVITNPTRVIFD